MIRLTAHNSRQCKADGLTPLRETAVPGSRYCFFAVASLLFSCFLRCYSFPPADSPPGFLRRTGSRWLIIRCKKQRKQPAPFGEGGSGKMRLTEERAGDRVPFFLQGRGRGRVAGAAVPAAGVPQIAFDAVQVGVRPGSLRVGLLLRALVRQVPVALGFPPQRLRRHAEALGRRFFCKRAFVGFEIHLRSPLGTFWVTPAGGRDCRAADNNRRRPARTRACRNRAGGRENPRYRSCSHSWPR